MNEIIDWSKTGAVTVRVVIMPEHGEEVRKALAAFLAATKDHRSDCVVSVERCES